MDMWVLVSQIAAFACAAFCIVLAYIVRSLRLDNKQLSLELERVKHSQKRSSNTQRAVIKGQVAEQFYPLLPSCPYPLADMRFIGQTFDYLVLNGYSSGDISEVVFVELKTGRSELSAIQRSLRQCIQQGRVSWQTIHIEPGEGAKVGSN